jgi:cyanophycinase-like exopeptidase
MPGALVLAGSGEFLPPMISVDEEVLRHTPGKPPRVAILPTAAGQEDVTPWIDNGVKHFGALGCEAYGVRALDRASVEDSAWVAALERADLIYLSGGSPGYLVETLRGSATWGAIVRVWERGGTLAGSSAGAMALGELTLVRRSAEAQWMPSHWESGLGLIERLGVIPHYDRFGPERTRPLVASAPAGMVVLGIDEDTVVLRADGAARVLGARTVTVWREGEARLFRAGEEIPAELVPLAD